MPGKILFRYDHPEKSSYHNPFKYHRNPTGKKITLKQHDQSSANVKRCYKKFGHCHDKPLYPVFKRQQVSKPSPHCHISNQRKSMKIPDSMISFGTIGIKTAEYK